MTQELIKARLAGPLRAAETEGTKYLQASQPTQHRLPKCADSALRSPACSDPSSSRLGTCLKANFFNEPWCGSLQSLLPEKSPLMLKLTITPWCSGRRNFGLSITRSRKDETGYATESVTCPLCEGGHSDTLDHILFA